MASTRARYCKECGAEARAPFKYCTRCGTKIPERRRSFITPALVISLLAIGVFVLVIPGLLDDLLALLGVGVYLCNGYLRYRGTGEFVHRAAAEETQGPIPPGGVVHHVDGNKLNNDPSNLRIMSAQEHGRLHN